MSFTPVFKGIVKNGKLTLTNQAAFLEYVRGLDGEVRLTVGKEEKNRTVDQNKFLWGVCYKALSDWNGNSAEEWHEMCKQMFLPPHQVMFEGKLFTMRLTTTTKSRKDFGEYVDKIIQFAAEHGVIIPMAQNI